MSDLTDEEIIATRRLHGLNDDLFKIEKKINKQEKELNDLEDFADLLRPEQRYYTNIIKKLVENARNRGKQ
jgi:predicted  nucleic acid-binding Zn-ribbon protein